MAVVLGALCAGLSLELFYIPHRFLDGGMVGLAVLTGRAVGLSPPVVLFLFNMACLYAGTRRLGGPFLSLTTTGFATLGAVLLLVGPLPALLPITPAAVIGGAGVGVGTALALRSGSALDGAEILALLLHSTRGLPVTWFLFFFNVLLFTLVAAVNGLSLSFHSILAQAAVQLVLLSLLRDGRRDAGERR